MHGYNGTAAETKPLVKSEQVAKAKLSGNEWMKSLESHYNNPELKSVRGDLHIISSSGTKGELIAKNVTPSEAWKLTKKLG